MLLSLTQFNDVRPGTRNSATLVFWPKARDPYTEYRLSLYVRSAVVPIEDETHRPAVCTPAGKKFHTTHTRISRELRACRVPTQLTLWTCVVCFPSTVQSAAAAAATSSRSILSTTCTASTLPVLFSTEGQRRMKAIMKPISPESADHYARIALPGGHLRQGRHRDAACAGDRI